MPLSYSRKVRVNCYRKRAATACGGLSECRSSNRLSQRTESCWPPSAKLTTGATLNRRLFLTIFRTLRQSRAAAAGPRRASKLASGVCVQLPPTPGKERDDIIQPVPPTGSSNRAYANVAELADALDLGSGCVGVDFQQVTADSADNL